MNPNQAIALFDEKLSKPYLIVVIKYANYEENVQVDSNFKLEDLFTIMASDADYRGLDILKNREIIYSTTTHLGTPKKTKEYTGKSEFYAFRDKPMKYFYKFVWKVDGINTHATKQDAISHQNQTKRVIKSFLK